MVLLLYVDYVVWVCWVDCELWFDFCIYVVGVWVVDGVCGEWVGVGDDDGFGVCCGSGG